MKFFKSLYLVLFILIYSCSTQEKIVEQEVNKIAESYVKLVLKIGQYDSGYIDAYWGPEEWRSSESLNLSEFPASVLRKKANLWSPAGRRRWSWWPKNYPGIRAIVRRLFPAPSLRYLEKKVRPQRSGLHSRIGPIRSRKNRKRGESRISRGDVQAARGLRKRDRRDKGGSQKLGATSQSARG